ncbi:MAG: hydroxymethylbilane synthase, partial [Enterocloster citroniae]|nr:hydroxymethylbilane synthase [Enterocloster citroniae]
MSKVVRIGTRKSALALIQTQLVAEELKQACPGLEIEVVTKDTLGDRILD